MSLLVSPHERLRVYICMHMCVLRSDPQAVSSIEKFYNTDMCKTAYKVV